MNAFLFKNQPERSGLGAYLYTSHNDGSFSTSSPKWSGLLSFAEIIDSVYDYLVIDVWDYDFGTLDRDREIMCRTAIQGDFLYSDKSLDIVKIERKELISSNQKQIKGEFG